MSNPRILEVGPGDNPDPRTTISIDNYSLYPDTTKARYRMDVHAMTFEDEYFDGVLMYEVLEHLENPIQALREIKRVIKPGGYLELSTPSALYYLRYARWVVRGIVEPSHDHLWIWTEGELKNLLKRAGWEVRELRYYNRYGHDGMLFGLEPRMDRVVSKLMNRLSRNILVRCIK